MEGLHLLHPIRVIGVGGGGSNAVNRMIQVGIAGVDFVAANTDVQALRQSESRNLLHLGPRVTRGLGAGANPEAGLRAANESSASIEEACDGAELLFVTAGMGGGTGSGATPKVARVARAMGAIVVGVVTMPFTFEGSRRRANAEEALSALRSEVDTLVVVYNDRLLKILDPQHARMDIAFRVADECLRQAIEGIAGLINNPGLINLDFADVKSVLQEGGLGHFSIGYGQGEHGAQEAMRRALSSPLLGRDGIEGAQAMIVNFRGGDQMSLHDVTRAMEPVSDLVVADAPIFFGTCNDNALDERVEVTLIAVGLNEPTVASLPRPRLSPIPLTQKKSTRKKIDVAPVDDNDSAPPRKVVGLPMIELPQPNETVWNSTALNFAGERTDPYPMDDLSVPAFIRRRKRVTA
jgi:cell division protein FtsZ